MINSEDVIYTQLLNERVKTLATIKQGLIKLTIEDQLPQDLNDLDMQYIFLVGSLVEVGEL